MEVEKFLKWSILDELYNERGDRFADNILKKMKEQNKELKAVNTDEELTKKIKEYVTDTDKQNELLRLVNKYELNTNADDDFWNKNVLQIRNVRWYRIKKYNKRPNKR